MQDDCGLPGDPDDLGPTPLAAPFTVAMLGLAMICCVSREVHGHLFAQVLAAPVAGRVIGRGATHPLFGPRAWWAYAFVAWLLVAGGTTLLCDVVGIIDERAAVFGIPVLGVLEGAVLAVPAFF